MNIIVVAHDIVAEKAHLMPWRTVIEVVYGLREMGNQVRLVSLGKQCGYLNDRRLPEHTYEISKAPNLLEQNLQELVSEDRPDIIFWPLAWRDRKVRARIIKKTAVPVVGWFPGGCYGKAATAYAVYRLGLRAALPYVIEAWSQTPRKVALWKESGVRRVLTMTEHTRNCVVRHGWAKSAVRVIHPGRENSPDEACGGLLPKKFTDWLAGQKYYLFMGPPSAIRGVLELLAAFEQVAAENATVRLVCLFRSDAVLDSELIRRRIESMQHRDRVYVCWESLSPEDLNGYMKECHIAVMPFILVPSEIPLAVIEASRWGKPVISTSPGGTGEYVTQFGLSPVVGDVKGLADAMLQLLGDEDLYKNKCAAALQAYQNHPTWKQVASQWAQVAEQALSG